MNPNITAWVPTSDEVRRIVAELRPVIDECVARSHRLLAGSPVDADRTSRASAA